jgi:glycosyltransferase involved in cell wall biosynthesis
MFATGLPQYEFLRFLGFKKNQILFGAYTANTELFNSTYLNNPKKKVYNQKVILFVGRLEEEKGIQILLNTVKKISSDKLKLIVVGNGSLRVEIEKETRVEYYKFMEQKSLLELLPKVDFFLLPSTYEPWGVVIHEMAAAGLPILCSDSVGARWSFVINNYNGFVFKSNSSSALYECLLKAINLSEEKLNLFKLRSFELSKSIKPELWAESINGLIYDL